MFLERPEDLSKHSNHINENFLGDELQFLSFEGVPNVFLFIASTAVKYLAGWLKRKLCWDKGTVKMACELSVSTLYPMYLYGFGSFNISTS